MGLIWPAKMPCLCTPVTLLIIAVTATIVSLACGSIPQQISLTYGATSSVMVVSWTSSSNSRDILVAYGTPPSALTRTVAPNAIDSYTYGAYTSPFLYRATLSNLTVGNVVYYYRIGSNYAGFSQTYSFKSNPGVGIAGVTFHILGDIGQL